MRQAVIPGAQRPTFRSAVFCWMVAVLALTLGAALPVQAVMVEGLYQARVPVENTGTDSREKGFASALRQVLVRVTGSDAVLEQEEGERLLADAQSLVEEYSYRKEDELILEVRFDASTLPRRLAEMGQPVWGVNRPGILAWVVVDERSGRLLLRRDEGDAQQARSRWGRDLLKAAENRGLPLMLPRYDQDEQSRLSLSEIWGQFMGPVEKVSAPYQADRLAVVRIAARGGSLEASWKLQVRSDSAMKQGSLSASSSEALMDDLLAAWAKEFAAVYAVDPSAMEDAQRLDVRVDGVTSLASYAAVRSALMRMEPVESASPVAVRQDQLQMRLRFAGDMRTLEEYVALDRRFEAVPEQEAARDQTTGGWLQEGQQPIPTGDGEETDSFSSLYPTLHYRWVADSDEDEEALENMGPLDESVSGNESANE